MIEDRNLKPGTALVVRYKDKEYRAKVVATKDGKVRYRLADGREFKSPSGAGSAVMGGAACNGWVFWSISVGKRATSRRSRTSSKVTRTAGRKNK
jgi:hypothetical protein